MDAVEKFYTVHVLTVCSTYLPKTKFSFKFAKIIVKKSTGLFYVDTVYMIIRLASPSTNWSQYGVSSLRWLKDITATPDHPCYLMPNKQKLFSHSGNVSP